MRFIVVIERSGDPESVRAHVAVPDPDSAGRVPGPTTACGVGTGGMVIDPWRPTRPEDRWYPPDLLERICVRCDRAVRFG